MTTAEDQKILDRVSEVYEFLVDETENPVTHRDRQKNQRLNDLLELFEYIVCNCDESPMEYWFKID